jgi:SH3 domain protein
LVLSQSLQGATKYVTDDLQLALHAQSNSKGKLLQKLPSGTKLEVLKEDGLFAKVKAPDGTVGWTKAGFLMTEKPARARVIELEQEQAQLKNDLVQAQGQLQTSNALAAELRAEKIQIALELAAEREKKQNDSTTISQLQQEVTSLRARLHPEDELQIPLRWGLITSAAGLLIGFIGGIALFDWLSRRRHGGYRIY